MMNCSGFPDPGQFLFGAWSYIGSWLGAGNDDFCLPRESCLEEGRHCPLYLGDLRTSLARARCLQKEKARTMTGFGDRDKRTA